MAYTDYTLGEHRELIGFGTADENRQIARSMAEQAGRTIHIFTTDLDPAVFNQVDFIEAIARMARSHSRARVSVLVQDSAKAVNRGHRLVELARRLSSRVEIRKPVAEYSDLKETFMVADGRGYFHRIQPDRYEGQARFHDPLQCREYVQRFDEIWQRSHGDRELRRVHL
ncbi:DUF7931 domain-containing protein [Thiohalomonas denitrificans]|uniref:DUF7931 domain-containing protein n=1 Tax=Thiohalomonas denitrificans TaxID=415747 RepID=UPI0026F035D6|nr:hypothetical protein [Thiohalomonas denitrificans]